MMLWSGPNRQFRILLYWQMLYLEGRVGGPYDGSDTYGAY